MILILAEKPSVGRALFSVVGANKTNKGYIEGCGWEQKWSFSQLPMIPEAWQFKVTESTKEHKFKGVATGSAGGYGFEVRCTLPKSKKGPSPHLSQRRSAYVSSYVYPADTPYRTAFQQG